MPKVKAWPIILKAIKELREQGSWCGGTHLQKSIYLLSALTEIDLSLDFILYKYGPFSFDLRDELDELVAAGFVRFEAQQPPYGPKLGVTPRGAQWLTSEEPSEGDSQAIQFVASAVANRGVMELERLATALFVTDMENPDELQQRASALRFYKPHVSHGDATAAVKEIDHLIASWASA